MLERIRFSITRLKTWQQKFGFEGNGPLAWKDKILDYEIETIWDLNRSILETQVPWKDKILDYEIETGSRRETDATSLCRSWKDKILDYEIETSCFPSWTSRDLKQLERIRFSITRLKLAGGGELDVPHWYLTWKDKILDSEIETGMSHLLKYFIRSAWKDKILDSEIENGIGSQQFQMPASQNLKG